MLDLYSQKRAERAQQKVQKMPPKKIFKEEEEPQA